MSKQYKAKREIGDSNNVKYEGASQRSDVRVLLWKLHMRNILSWINLYKCAYIILLSCIYVARVLIVRWWDFDLCDIFLYVNK